jgi:hypothetical protein
METKANCHKANGVEQNVATAPTWSVGALKLKEARQYLGGLSTPTIHRLMKRLTAPQSCVAPPSFQP